MKTKNDTITLDIPTHGKQDISLSLFDIGNDGKVSLLSFKDWREVDKETPASQYNMVAKWIERNTRDAFTVNKGKGGKGKFSLKPTLGKKNLEWNKSTKVSISYREREDSPLNILSIEIRATRDKEIMEGTFMEAMTASSGLDKKFILAHSTAKGITLPGLLDAFDELNTQADLYSVTDEMGFMAGILHIATGQAKEREMEAMRKDAESKRDAESKPRRNGKGKKEEKDSHESIPLHATPTDGEQKPMVARRNVNKGNTLIATLTGEGGK